MSQTRQMHQITRNNKELAKKIDESDKANAIITRNS